MALPRLTSYYGPGDDPIVLHDLRCNGDDDSLMECPSRNIPTGTSHFFDAGVYCYTGNGMSFLIVIKCVCVYIYQTLPGISTEYT